MKPRSLFSNLVLLCAGVSIVYLMAGVSRSLPIDIPVASRPTATTIVSVAKMEVLPPQPPPAATSPLQPVALTATPPVGNRYVTVKESLGANLRYGPSTQYKIVHVASLNESLQWLTNSPDNNWVRVRTDDGITGWISSELISYE